jgi:hypothetical protein
MDAFTAAYIEALLWSGMATDENGAEYESLSQFDADDIEPETLKKIVADCNRFQQENETALAKAAELGEDDKRAGHDFALTRNRHGAGFWDRGLGEVGEQLTKAAHLFGSWYFWIENKKVYGEDG